jgi:flagellar protein FlgJ
MLATLPSAIDPATLSRLREASRSESGGALDAAASQFEALFLQMMLKSMRAGSLGGGLMDSKQVEFYREMFDQQLAVALSKSRTVGIADVVVGQLGGEPTVDPDTATGALSAFQRPPLRAPAPSPETATEAAAPSGAAATTPQAPQDSRNTRVAEIAGPEKFVSSLWSVAEKTAALLGVPPRVLLAQAALETAWGRSIPKLEDGSSSNNLFGIKAHPGWEGRRAHARTLEFTEAGAQRVRAQFRAYDSLLESFQDYGRLISGDPRYAQALQSGGDPGRYLEALQQGGYATDPSYAAKIKSIVDGDTLVGALAKLTPTSHRADR